MADLFFEDGKDGQEKDIFIRFKISKSSENPLRARQLTFDGSSIVPMGLPK